MGIEWPDYVTVSCDVINCIHSDKITIYDNGSGTMKINNLLSGLEAEGWHFVDSLSSVICICPECSKKKGL